LNKCILVFLHGAPDQIPAGRFELEPESRRRLEAFRSKVATRHVKSWTTKDQLKSAIILALVHAVRTKPAVGWVRNEGLENQELLRRLATLQEKFDCLEDEAKALRDLVGRQSVAGRYQDFDEFYEVSYRIPAISWASKVAITWSDLFFGSAHRMLIPCDEASLSEALNGVTFRAVIDAPLPDELAAAVKAHIAKIVKEQQLKPGYEPSAERILADIRIEDTSLRQFTHQLMALGLIEPQAVLTEGVVPYIQKRGYARHWTLTTAGRTRYLSRTAIPARNTD
jgi:hypothetical protein